MSLGQPIGVVVGKQAHGKSEEARKQGETHISDFADALRSLHQQLIGCKARESLQCARFLFYYGHVV